MWQQTCANSATDEQDMQNFSENSQGHQVHQGMHQININSAIIYLSS